MVPAARGQPVGRLPDAKRKAPATGCAAGAMFEREGIGREKKPASTDLKFVAEVLPVPGPFALMRITRLCSQRLLGRNLITVFSTVNTLQRRTSPRSTRHARDRCCHRHDFRPRRCTHANADGFPGRWETAVFKLFAASTCLHASSAHRSCPRRAHAAVLAADADARGCGSSHRRERIRHRTSPIARKLREPRRRECRLCAGIRLRAWRCEASSRTPGRSLRYSSRSAA